MGAAQRRKQHTSEGRLAALICLLSGLLLAATAAWTQPQPQKLLRLVYWQEEGERLAGSGDLFDDFEQANPGVRTNLTYERWSQAYPRLRYWTHSLRDYAPDLTVVHDVWLPAFADAWLPLEGKLTPADLAGVLPSVLDRCKVGGKLLGVPWVVSTRVLYYRSDLLETAKLKPPATLEELRGAAAKLREQGVYGIGLPARAGGGAVDTFLGLLWALGGQPVEEGKIRLRTPQAAAALQYWADLERAGLTQPEGLSWSAADLEEAFALGRIGLILGGPELGRHLRRAYPKLPFGICPLPADKARPSQVSVQVLVAFAGTKNPEEAVRLLKYMISPRVQRAMWLMGGLPTRQELLAQALHDPAQRPFVEGLEQAQGLPLQEADRLSAVIEDAVALALSGRQAPAEAIETALAHRRETPF